MRSRTALAPLLTALALAVTGLVLSPSAALATTPTPTTDGSYEGPCNTHGMTSFESWRGVPASYAADGIDGSRWDSIAHPTFASGCWRGDAHRLVLAVPILVPGATLAAGAAGAYDAPFTSMGKQLVADGHGNAVLRLGWEFNGSWQPWAASQDPASFVAYWRHLVGVLRAVPGSHFSFDWNVASGDTQLDAASVYPGDDVVDSIGVDVYDGSWLPDTYPYPAGLSDADRTARQLAAWQGLRGGDLGLDHWAAFAAAHGRALDVPEWGLIPPGADYAGGDDPVFVAGMRQWTTQNHVAFANYFDYTGTLGDSNLRSGAFPLAAAAYLALFGNHPASAPAGLGDVVQRLASLPIPTGGPSTTALRGGIGWAEVAPLAGLGTRFGAGSTAGHGQAKHKAKKKKTKHRKHKKASQSAQAHHVATASHR